MPKGEAKCGGLYTYPLDRARNIYNEDKIEIYNLAVEEFNNKIQKALEDIKKLIK